MADERKHKLFFILGPSRIGKSTAVHAIREHSNPIVIHTDAVRSGVRQALLGPYPKGISSVDISVTTHFDSENKEELSEQLPVRNEIGEDAYAWDGVLGMLAHYHADNTFDVLVEGVAATLQRVFELKNIFPNFQIRAVCVGYTNEAVADEIIAYSNKHHDHLWHDMQRSLKGEDHIREMVRHQIPASEEAKVLIQQYGDGFKYVERSVGGFDLMLKEVVDYYLEE